MKNRKSIVISTIVATSIISFGVYQFKVDASNIQTEAISKKTTSEKINHPKGHIHAKLEDYTLNEAIESADLIVKAKIENSVGEISEPSPKTLFNVEVLEEYKNIVSSENDVIVMQQGNSDWSFNENSLFKPGEEYVLFLKKADVSYAPSNTFWILGEETTFYKVEGDEFVKQSLVDESLDNITNSVSLHSKGKIEKQHLNKQKFISKLKTEVKRGKNK